MISIGVRFAARFSMLGLEHSMLRIIRSAHNPFCMRKNVAALVTLAALPLALSLTAGRAHAQESESSSKAKVDLPNAAPATSSIVTAPVAAPEATSTTAGVVRRNKQFEDSLTLTDAKLKADAGSLSRFSMKASLSYFGPTFGDLSASEQPNPDGSVGNYSQAIKGSVSTRYRLSPDSAVSAGTGISLIKPFHGWDRTDVSNPFVSYDYSSRFGKLQMRNSPGLTISTVPNYTAIGQIGGVSWDNSLVYGIAGGLALSFDTSFNYWIFTREYRPGPTKKGGDGNASLYSVSWYPGFKFNFSDRFNVNTSAGFQLANPRSEDVAALWNKTVSLRLGMGYAFTRDIYFAPYVQTFVTKLAFDTTTINVAGVFSVL